MSRLSLAQYLHMPNAALVVDAISRLSHARRLSIVAVTHSPELVHRLGGALLYLVGGRVEAYERLDDSASRVADPRVHAFLAGDLRLSPSA